MLFRSIARLHTSSITLAAVKLHPNRKNNFSQIPRAAKWYFHANRARIERARRVNRARAVALIDFVYRPSYLLVARQFVAE